MSVEQEEATKRRAVNLTIRQDLISEAKKLNLNASRAAEVGISEAIKSAKEQAWLKENQESIGAHNKRLENSGPLLKAGWVE